MSEEFTAYNVTNVECVFCSKFTQDLMVATNGSVFAIEDKYPVTSGHLLVIPYRHADDYFSLTSQECRDAEHMLRMLKNKIQEEDNTVTGFNVGINCGESAGQTVMHAHIHLIPRRDGDIDDPTGGVRGCIPNNRKY